MNKVVKEPAQNTAEYWDAHPCFTTVRVNGELRVVRVFPDVVCDPDHLAANHDVVRFEVGQTYEVPELKAKDGRVLKSSVFVTIIARNEQWLFFKDHSRDKIGCCLAKVKTDQQGRVCEYLKYWGGMIQRGTYATCLDVEIFSGQKLDSNAKFYLSEYRKCCELYRECPYEERRRRELYSYMGASMLNAYIDAAFTKKTMRG